MGKGQGIETGLVYVTYLKLTTLEDLMCQSARGGSSATRTHKELALTFPIVIPGGLYGLLI